MVMNANAGGGMVQGDDDEENAQRDWLDYVYMAVRISMLMSIFWFYSSAERLIIMGLIVFLVWLIQSGVFNLNRAQRNRPQGSYFLLFYRGGSCARRGAGFPWGWCMREPYCPLSSAVCNATIPIFPLFEMAESTCSPFCYVLHYLLFIKFISAFYHI
jgi:hypothetical protein